MKHTQAIHPRHHTHVRLCVAVALGILLGVVGLVMAFSYEPRVLPHTVTQLPTVLESSVEQVGYWRVPVPEPVAVSSDQVVTMLFVGDMMFDRTVATRSLKARDFSYPFKRLPEGWLNQADYTVANLEGPVTDKRLPPVKTIDFQFDPAVISVLKAQGIDAVSQANNHSLDQGRIGADDSRVRLQAGGLLVFGDQVRDDEVALATTTIRGQRFAFVGFNTTDNPLDREAATKTLASAHAQAEQVIVFMHWGLEYKDRAPANIVDEAHWLVDHGADVIIGGHPHWVQGIEAYKGHPIVYSLGNFIFDQDFSAETRQGMAVKLIFSDSGLQLEPIPVQIDVSQPRVLEGTEKAKRLQSLATISDANLREQIQASSVLFEQK